MAAVCSAFLHIGPTISIKWRNAAVVVNEFVDETGVVWARDQQSHYIHELLVTIEKLSEMKHEHAWIVDWPWRRDKSQLLRHAHSLAVSVTFQENIRTTALMKSPSTGTAENVITHTHIVSPSQSTSILSCRFTAVDLIVSYLRSTRSRSEKTNC